MQNYRVDCSNGEHSSTSNQGKAWSSLVTVDHGRYQALSLACGAVIHALHVISRYTVLAMNPVDHSTGSVDGEGRTGEAR